MLTKCFNTFILELLSEIYLNFTSPQFPNFHWIFKLWHFTYLFPVFINLVFHLCQNDYQYSEIKMFDVFLFDKLSYYEDHFSIYFVWKPCFSLSNMTIIIFIKRVEAKETEVLYPAFVLLIMLCIPDSLCSVLSHTFIFKRYYFCLKRYESSC